MGVTNNRLKVVQFNIFEIGDWELFTGFLGMKNDGIRSAYGQEHIAPGRHHVHERVGMANG